MNNLRVTSEKKLYDLIGHMDEVEKRIQGRNDK